MEKEKRIVYHSGFVKIEKPDIHHGRKNADFGQGFYLSDNEEFYKRWAKFRKGEETMINRYELDLNGLKVRYLKRDEEWFSYHYDNRYNKEDIYNDDVIIGPIANDTIYDTFGIISSGILSKEEAMTLLLIGPEYTQIVLKSEKTVRQLKWLDTRGLKQEEVSYYQKTVKEEEKEYQKLFTEAMSKMKKSAFSIETESTF